VEGCNVTLTCSKCLASGTQCAFEDTYLTCDLKNLTATCSVAGGIYRDSVLLGDLAAHDVRFGGIDSQTRNFDQFQNIDGIMGLAYKPLGFDYSPFQRVVDQNDDVENVIQTCLTHDGGLLLLGEDPEMDKEFYYGELQYTPITLDSWYAVNATQLAVGGKPVNISLLELNGPYPSDPCIVDSGTNFLSLTTPAWRGVKEYFAEVCTYSKMKGVCDVPEGKGLFDGVEYNLTSTDISMFPEIEITLVGDVRLLLSAEDYLVPVDGNYRLGMTEGDCIIGNTHMLRYWTVYDVKNSRIGFAPANREKCAAKRNVLLD